MGCYHCFRICERSNIICEDCKPRYWNIQKKPCLKCGLIKDWSDFSPQKRGLFNLCSHCRNCSKEKKKKYKATENGFLHGLFDAAKLNSKKRASQGRTEAGIFELELGDLQRKLEEQEGRCYYSNIKMSLKSHSNWKCSLERLDTSKGYIVENIALVAHEFNGRAQWSLEKISMVKSLLSQDISEQVATNVLLASEVAVCRASSKKLETVMENGVTLYECRKCQKYLPTECFTKSWKNGCKSCLQTSLKVYRSGLRGKLKQLLNSGIKSCKQRSQTSSIRTNNDFSITFDDLLNMYVSQKGKCAYSGIPMKLNGADWTISLERLNPRCGYTLDNIALICGEFNSCDFSVMSATATEGSNWSVEKFQFLLEHI